MKFKKQKIIFKYDSNKKTNQLLCQNYPQLFLLFIVFRFSTDLYFDRNLVSYGFGFHFLKFLVEGFLGGRAV